MRKKTKPKPLKKKAKQVVKIKAREVKKTAVKSTIKETKVEKPVSLKKVRIQTAEGWKRRDMKAHPEKYAITKRQTPS